MLFLLYFLWLSYVHFVTFLTMDQWLLHNSYSFSLGQFSHRVAMSVCLSVFPWQFKTPFSGGCGDLRSKGVPLILACRHVHFIKQHILVLNPNSKRGCTFVKLTDTFHYIAVCVVCSLGKWSAKNDRYITVHSVFLSAMTMRAHLVW